MSQCLELTDALAHRSCWLQPVNPRHPSHRLTLYRSDAFRLGRRVDCEQAFPNDFRISSVHASLVLVSSERASTRSHLAIEDSSVNGTFVNGERVPRAASRELRSGDQIFLVIPDQALLQPGYMGSLTNNFVGYIFRYTDEAEDGRPHTAPSQAAEWPPARGLLPRPAPGVGDQQEPPAAASFDRGAEVRQTTAAPSWLGALAAAGGDAPAVPAAQEAAVAAAAATAGGGGGGGGAQAGAAPATAAPAAGAGATAAGAAAASAAAASHDGGVRARCEQGEHVSFAQWWLGNLAGEQVT